MSNEYTAEVKRFTENLLHNEEDYFRLKQSIDGLYKHFSQITGITAGDLTNAHFTAAQNGEVVAAPMAAHCLLEIKRTTAFLRGIHDAILTRLSTQKSIQILYAGCGPYATLITPLLSLFPRGQIQVVLADINKASLQSAKALLKKLQLDHFLSATHTLDLTDPDIHLDNSFDVIISETMQNTLSQECQVPLTRNLIRFLSRKGTFIPQKIDLELYARGGLDIQDPKGTPKEWLGTVYSLDYQNVPEPDHRTELSIKENITPNLHLYTTIYLHGKHVLEAFDCSLTMPQHLTELKNPRPQRIAFTYREGDKMGVEHEMIYED